MWKKTELEESQQSNPSVPTHDSGPAARDRAKIGPSIFIRGDISGGEDLVIHGRVEGKINFKQHNVTVGKNGRVKADIVGKIISIEGEVEGNVYGEDKIIIRQSGTIRGNITAPRVNLEDGSKFKGSIDMDSPAEKPSRIGDTLPREKAVPQGSSKKVDLRPKVSPTSP